jgi:hypothetical protein
MSYIGHRSDAHRPYFGRLKAYICSNPQTSLSDIKYLKEITLSPYFCLFVTCLKTMKIIGSYVIIL